MAGKITLAEAHDGGAVGLTISCVAAPFAAGGCRHSAVMALSEAMERFGPDRRLDALPFACSACGRRDVDVRPLFDNAPEGQSRTPYASRLIDAWRARPPGARR